MGLAVLLWTLGLSEWGTSHVLHALEAGIHRSSVHRDRLRAGALLQRRGMAAGPGRVGGGEGGPPRPRPLVRDPPADGGDCLLRLERRARASPELRRLVVDLIGRWPALGYHPGRPWGAGPNHP